MARDHYVLNVVSWIQYKFTICADNAAIFGDQSFRNFFAINNFTIKYSINILISSTLGLKTSSKFVFYLIECILNLFLQMVCVRFSMQIKINCRISPHYVLTNIPPLNVLFIVSTR